MRPVRLADLKTVDWLARAVKQASGGRTEAVARGTPGVAPVSEVNMDWRNVLLIAFVVVMALCCGDVMMASKRTRPPDDEKNDDE